MRKFILIVFVIGCLSVSESFAQTELGNWMAGGNASFRVSTDKNDYLQLQLSPLAGIFVADNFAMGAEIPLIYTRSDLYRSTSFGIMPFVRYYFARYENSALFGHAAFGFGKGTTKYSYDAGIGGDYSSTSKSTRGIIGMGYTYFINKSIGVEGLASYNWIGGDYHQSDIGLNIGFQIYLGKRE